MISNFMIDFQVEARDEGFAAQQLQDFLAYSMKHCGQEYGIAEWEWVEFVTEEEDAEYDSLGV